MKKIKEAICEYEYMTAGRFYDKTQKEIIFDLIARANFLCEQELTELKVLLFSEEIDDYKTETDCANGLLMLSLIKKSDYKKDILLNRKKTIEKLSEQRFFYDRGSWLKFINSDKNSFNNLFEKAVYLCSICKIEKAVNIFKQLAEACHYLSVKLTVALCKEWNDEREEARYLILLNRIKEELLYNEEPTEYEIRLHKIQNNIPKETIEEVYNKKITYFDENIEFGKHIGFN